MNQGRLISFEGLDGAGKTTQIKLLGGWLESHGIPYLSTREPGGTPGGVKIRELLLDHPELSFTPLAQAYLFQADRAQHFAEVILPSLREGKLVITDRCLDASIAYQGYGDGVDMKFIEELSRRSTEGRVPDLTILLDLNPSQVHHRAGVVRQLDLPFPSDTPFNQNGVREEQNRFDAAAQSFHRRVRDGFRALALAYPERIKVVDASLSPKQIHKRIIALIEPLLDNDLVSAKRTFRRDS